MYKKLAWPSEDLNPWPLGLSAAWAANTISFFNKHCWLRMTSTTMKLKKIWKSKTELQDPKNLQVILRTRGVRWIGPETLLMHDTSPETAPKSCEKRTKGLIKLSFLFKFLSFGEIKRKIFSQNLMKRMRLSIILKLVGSEFEVVGCSMSQKCWN